MDLGHIYQVPHYISTIYYINVHKPFSGIVFIEVPSVSTIRPYTKFAKFQTNEPMKHIKDRPRGGHLLQLSTFAILTRCYLHSNLVDSQQSCRQFG